MLRSLFLVALIAVVGLVDWPDQLAAQTIANVAPVPGPYQAMPAQAGNPFSNPRHAQAVPYWMRQKSPGSGSNPTTGGPVPRNYIRGWVWSPYAPNGPQMMTGPGTRPAAGWGQTGYAPGYAPGYPQGSWPVPFYGAPQGYGAQMQPNQ